MSTENSQKSGNTKIGLTPMPERKTTVNQPKTVIEGIKRNEIYAGGISFQIATCDLRCVDRYDNNQDQVIWFILQETER